MKPLAAEWLLFVALTASAGEVMTNADVVKLVEAGLSAETILAKIEASTTRFDTSTDTLVALARQGVPDIVIRRMVGSRQQAKKPRAAALVRRYDVAIHRDKHARCDGGELRVDATGIKASRCGDLDFVLTWDDVRSACFENAFRGVVVFRTSGRERRVSTTIPVQAKKLVETIRAVRPQLELAERCD